MASLVSITANPAQFEQARAVLSGRELRQAIWQATKRTTNAAVAISVDVVMEHLNLGKKFVRESITTKMEHGDVPVGTVNISGKGIPIVKFQGQKKIVASGSGFSVTIYKDKSPVIFRHGFRAKVQSEQQAAQGASHTGFFTRSTHLPTTGPNAGRGYRLYKHHGKLIKQKLAITSGGRAGSLALKQYWGPSIPKAVEIPKIQEEVVGRIGDRFQHELDGQISRFVNGVRITDNQ